MIFSLLKKIIFSILINAFALWVVVEILPGVKFEGGIFDYLFAGFVFGLINFSLKPILKILSFPLIVLSFGTFSVLINLFLFWLFDKILESLTIEGFFSYIGAMIMMSLVNFLLSFLKE